MPGGLNKRGKEFRENAKATGHAPSTALKMWIDSPERATLHANAPLQELKRRRVVPKECTENPLIRAAARLAGC